MNINELPAFLELYGQKMGQKTKKYGWYSIEVSTDPSTPFSLIFLSHCYDEEMVSYALTFDALLEKMKKDIDETP